MLSCSAALAALFLSGCTRTYQSLAYGRAASEQTVERYGSGRYPYRFVLMNPSTNKPWPNHPFRLFAKNLKLPSPQYEGAVYHGVTDANGMTPVFQMKYLLSDQAWVVIERVGEGRFGKSFIMKSTGRNPAPIYGYPYALVVCSQPPIVHVGTSDAHGNTAYLAMDAVGTILLMAGGETTDEKEIARDACAEKEQ
jgi:hypothetical protein